MATGTTGASGAAAIRVERALGPEGCEHAAARPGALGEDHRGDAAARHLLLPEPAGSPPPLPRDRCDR